MQTKSPPNILWIMSDQHHAACWGGGGRAAVRTPALDGLARRGVSFSRAYCNNPICGPSRACFLTGQYLYRHGVSGNKLSELDTGPHRNLAKLFRDNGYETALIGKGHLPRSWMEEGFGHRRYCDLTDAERKDPRTCHYYDYLVHHGIADDYDLGVLPAGRPGSRMEAFISKIPLEHSVEVWTGNEAVAFLESRSTEQPFFMQLSFQRPHDPYAPSAEQENAYNPEDIEVPANAVDYLQNRMRGKPRFQREYSGLPPGSGYPYRPLGEDDLKHQLAAYYTLISVIDEQIGRVLAHLKSSGHLENTIVVYHADHGDFAGEHGLMLKNFGIYEAIHRIPWILSYPGCPAGTIDPRMVESVDLFPTLCDLAGVKIPAGGDGHSLARDADEWRSHVVCEWDFFSHPQARVYAVRNEQFRLVYYPMEPDDGELYDLHSDPGELYNLWASHDSVRSQMLSHLVNYLAGFPRVHSPEDDRVFVARHRHSLTSRIHHEGLLWSEAAQALKPVMV